MTDPVINSFVLGDYQTNCFVVRPQPEATRCWIVDCGFEPAAMLDWIVERSLTPVALLLTHCHSDHIAGVDEAIARFGAMPMYVHEAEAGFCSDPMLNLSALTWRVLHSPGHSPGGVLFVHDASHQAIVGDTIFAGSIGRHDFPTSNVGDLRCSVAEVVMSLPDETTLFPGHGPSTTVGRERATNPFVLYGF
ncbi:MAG: MBL fold metallo-hydrolase [Planctomycetota bacterium]